MVSFLMVLGSTGVVALVLVLFVELYFNFHPNAKKVNTFKGPKVRHVIGNLTDIWTDEETIFNRLREWAKDYYPNYKLWSSTYFYAINLFAPEDNQLILSNVKHNEKSDLYLLLQDWLEEGLLTSKGDKWIHRRKILTPTFHFSILKQFIGIFNKHSKQFTEDIAKSPSQSLIILPHIHKCSLHTIAEAAMGTSLAGDASEKKYRKAIHDLGNILVYRILRPWLYFRVTNLFAPMYWKERFLIRYLQNFTKRVIDEREANFDEKILEVDDKVEEDDVIGIKKNKLAMLDLLISAKKQNLIDYNGIREEVDTFMFEGHDTLSMAMGFCCMLVACNKDAQDKVYEELQSIFGDDNRDPTMEDLQNMHYLERVIKETLRLYPSVPLISRITGEEVTTHNGNVIPKGALIILHIFDTHRLPAIYPEPEKFDPDRFLPEQVKNRHPYAYLPFSAGSRNCIGQRYAMLNMKSFMATTLRRFELLPVDTPETVKLVADIILRAKTPIRVIFRDRKEV